MMVPNSINNEKLFPLEGKDYWENAQEVYF